MPVPAAEATAAGGVSQVTPDAATEEGGPGQNATHSGQWQEEEEHRPRLPSFGSYRFVLDELNVKAAAAGRQGKV